MLTKLNKIIDWAKLSEPYSDTWLLVMNDDDVDELHRALTAQLKFVDTEPRSLSMYYGCIICRSKDQPKGMVTILREVHSESISS